jgi:uncharacterized membrane protein (UPF0136 family)
MIWSSGKGPLSGREGSEPLMDLIKKIASIVIGGAVALGVVVGAISWFQMTPDERSALLSTVWRSLAWIGIVLVLPWATYFVTTWVAKRESNGISAALVAGYTLVGLGVLLWLFDFSIRGTTPVVLCVLGGLIALAYNLLVCDWIAERLG